MAFERDLARMTLRRLESTDSFPERHYPEHHQDDDSSSSPVRPTASARIIPSSRRSAAAPRRPSESPDGYEMRLRYHEAEDVLKLDLEESRKPPFVWDYIYDPVRLPPSGMHKTSVMKRLGSVAIRRAWRRRCDTQTPSLQQPRTVEAMMLYERGDVVEGLQACSRCRGGAGASRECAVLAGVVEGTCSNCLYAGVQDHCDVDVLKSKDAQEKREDDDDKRQENSDFALVLKLIRQMKQSEIPGAKGTDVATMARRIEEAALQVARAAREWGLKEGH